MMLTPEIGALPSVSIIIGFSFSANTIPASRNIANKYEKYRHVNTQCDVDMDVDIM